ncbi:MAG: hypothetical protein JWO35_364, partial [Candidatus Saccharibacteria bacterium]|nr:hypothetical protein [Candidatus Saccharibacteria bacterium]
KLGTAHKVFQAILGVVGVVAGIFILGQPAAGGVAFVWALGLYAIVLGTVGMAIALELRAGLLELGEEKTTDSSISKK